ncbi:MAG: TlpA disulfide reductase family protein [Thermodesulfobacteriota bacterium]
MKYSGLARSSGALVFTFIALLFLVKPAAASLQMPSFTLPDVVTGKSVSSSQFAGKTLLITFFATWCPPCMQEVPELISLQEQYADKGFSVVALSVDQGGAGVVKKLVEQRSINYPVLMANGDVARNFGGVVGIPTSFLVNSKGHVVKKYPGYIPHVILERDIKSVMN